MDESWMENNRESQWRIVLHGKRASHSSSHLFDSWQNAERTRMAAAQLLTSPRCFPHSLLSLSLDSILEKGKKKRDMAAGGEMSELSWPSAGPGRKFRPNELYPQSEKLTKDCGTVGEMIAFL